jgi:hypothetical protein
MRDSKLTTYSRTFDETETASFNAIAFYLDIADMLAKEGL